MTKYIDVKIMASAAAGVALFGALIYVANKSGVGVVKDAAKIAQGG